jgi:pimeloyl-[acyl-carrier protein] methyl ester esterase
MTAECAPAETAAPVCVVLLPGLDGTGRLFAPLVATAPVGIAVQPIALPKESLSYDALSERVLDSLPQTRSLILLAESYSGPLAAKLASQRSFHAVIFCNSFVTPPRQPLWRFLVRPEFVHFAVSSPFLLRQYLLGQSASRDLVQEVVSACLSVPAHVLASRVRQLLTTNAAPQFARSRGPVLYLRGTEDRLVTSASFQRMEEIRPVIKLDISGPHLLLQTRPQASWNAILQFLMSLQP